MLDLYRFNMADLEDVKLQDRSKTEIYDDGQWLTPVGNLAQEWTMSATGTEPVDAPTRLAKMLFMEKGRTDSKAVGKMTCVSGAGVRGRTDQFIAASAGSMTVGIPLTIVLDTDGVVKFDVAVAGNIVKAHVFVAPALDPDGAVHFEFCTPYTL
jgi:hypothetical protein